VSLRIFHISDTHLGFTDLDKVGRDGLNCRETDFYHVFRSFVDEVIDKKPDFVIHTGDFFHRPSPPNRPVIEALTQLKRISGTGIPFIVIAGNHSTPKTVYTAPIIKAFSNIDNVYPFFEQRYEKICLNGVFFHPFPHVNDDRIFLEEVDRIAPEKNAVNILMLHNSVGSSYIMEEYGERIFPTEKIKIFREFDYVGLGHWHSFGKIPKTENAYYSGSSERLSDRECGKPKGYIDLVIENGLSTVEFRELPARKWHKTEVDNCGEMLVEEILRAVKSHDDIEIPDSLITVNLNSIKSEQSASITNTDIQKLFDGALHVGVKRVFDKRKISISDIGGGNESLEALFYNFMKDSLTDKTEFSDLKEAASKYFSN
jgi:DNA repair protein SbcD/Mre11